MVMRLYLTGLLALIIISLPISALAQDDDGILSIYEGSDLRYDDQIGFEEFPVVMNDSTVTVVDGIIRRQFCRAPEGRSPLEIMRNYESAIQQENGTVLFRTREPISVEIDENELYTYLGTHRPERGLATNVMSYTRFYLNYTDFMSGRISMADRDAYVIITAGRGEPLAREQDRTYYELITIELEPMELGMVTTESLQHGMETQGRVAIYNIYFDTGESEVKEDSFEALDIIAGFLRAHPENKYLVVGHTDNVGGLDMNLNLSEARASAVVQKLIDEHGIDEEQILSVGVGSAAPLASNSDEDGRARNRRVEIVEL